MSDEQEIIDSANRWKQQEHDRELHRMKLQDNRRRMVWENLFGVPGLLVLLAVVSVSFVFIVARTRWTHEVTDCSGADPERIERMKSECEGLTFMDDKTKCHRRMVELICETKLLVPPETP